MCEPLLEAAEPAAVLRLHDMESPSGSPVFIRRGRGVGVHVEMGCEPRRGGYFPGRSFGFGSWRQFPWRLGRRSGISCGTDASLLSTLRSACCRAPTPCRKPSLSAWLPLM